MADFQIINNVNEIHLSKSWVDSPKFNSKDKIVNYMGREYQILKKERYFSCAEKIGRVFLGILVVYCTLGCAIFIKTIMNLLTKEKETKRFGIIHDPTKGPTDKKIQSLNIGPFCMTTTPCQHDCTITYSDGQERNRRLNGVEIKELIAELPKENVINPYYDKHFSKARYVNISDLIKE